jgi:hypothetical protein
MTASLDLGAPQLDLVCDAGSDADFTVTLVDPDTNLPINLTGSTVVMRVKFGYAEPTALLTASSAIVANSYITLTPLIGKCAIHLDSIDTGTLAAPKVMVYDLMVTTSGATNRRLFGRFNTRPQVVA